MRKICYNNKDHMQAGMICGGWDPYEGGQVFEIPLGGTIMPQKFAIGGSGSTYIYGLVDSTYKEGMTKEECKEFVKKGNIKYYFLCLEFPFVTIFMVFGSDFTCHGKRWFIRWCHPFGCH